MLLATRLGKHGADGKRRADVHRWKGIPAREPFIRARRLVGTLPSGNVLEKYRIDRAESRGLRHVPRFMPLGLVMSDDTESPRPGEQCQRGNCVARTVRILAVEWLSAGGLEEMANTGIEFMGNAESEYGPGKFHPVARLPAQWGRCVELGVFEQ